MNWSLNFSWMLDGWGNLEYPLRGDFYLCVWVFLPGWTPGPNCTKHSVCVCVCVFVCVCLCVCVCKICFVLFLIGFSLLQGNFFISCMAITQSIGLHINWSQTNWVFCGKKFGVRPSTLGHLAGCQDQIVLNFQWLIYVGAGRQIGSPPVGGWIYQWALSGS